MMMKEIVVLTGREGQDEPPRLPEEVWVSFPLAATGEVTMWFIAADSPHAVFDRSMRVAVATAVGERIEPFGPIDGARRVLYAVPKADTDDLVALGAIAENIRQQEGWHNPKAMFGIINIPSRDHLPALDAVAEQFLPSVVFIFQPTALALNEDEAVELTETMQEFARRHETAVVFCLGASEEFIESLES